jgi:hypothetical protein
VPEVAFGVLLAIAVSAGVGGILVGRTRHWMSATACYVEYLLVGSLIPLALWVLGVYHRLGFT